MYPSGTTQIYSNLTPRKSRMNGVNEVVVFGIQYFVLEYLIEQWNDKFFGTELERKYVKDFKEKVISKYKRLMDNTLGKDVVDMKHIEQLWDLGYMPLKIKALPEGTLCPIGVPCLTITNTVDHAFWLVNYLETILSCTVWQPMTSATIAHQYHKLLCRYALETVGSIDFVQWQGHDFSMRGMSSLESACTSGAGHLLSFTGTDTIPAIEFLEQYYSADVERDLVGGSVPATEHSVMCMGLKDSEINTFRRLMALHTKGPLSVVSDTWDLTYVASPEDGILRQLKEEILIWGAGGGKLVIRPDSGDPVDIICGTGSDLLTDRQKAAHYPGFFKKGLIECLWDIFGGTVTPQGYKVLNPCVGSIYGDSITLERAEQICERLKIKGFASTNIVFGVGSFTYQMNTRDTFGFAMKATYGEVRDCGDLKDCLCDEHCGNIKPKGREIFKDPITDSGEKKSACGLIRVDRNEEGKVTLYDKQTKKQEEQGLLKTIFLDGKMLETYTLAQVRANLKAA